MFSFSRFFFLKKPHTLSERKKEQLPINHVTINGKLCEVFSDQNSLNTILFGSPQAYIIHTVDYHSRVGHNVNSFCMHISYLLLIPAFLDLQHRQACQHKGHKRMRIICPASKRIIFVSALYGSTKRGVFGHNGDIDCGDAEKSLLLAKQKCQGKPRCTLRAANSAFGDPCSGIVKCLKVGSKQGRSYLYANTQLRTWK